MHGVSTFRASPPSAAAVRRATLLLCWAAAAALPGASRCVAALDVLLIHGDPAPGIAGAAVESPLGATLNAAGQVAVWGELSLSVGGVTADNDTAVWIATADATTLVARTGSGGVPGAAGADFDQFRAISLSDNGRLALRGSLKVGVGGVTTANNQGAWEFAPGGDSVLARTGDVAPPDMPGAMLDSVDVALLQSTSGLVGAGNRMLSGVGGATGDSNYGAWLLDSGGSGALLAREGVTPPPELEWAKFDSFAAGAVNDARQVAVIATLHYDFPVTVTNDTGLWRLEDGAAGVLLAREGDTPPGATAAYIRFSAPRLNLAGETAWEAKLASGQSGIWRRRGAATEAVMISGAGSVPGVPGAEFAPFAVDAGERSGAVLGAAGQVLFSATLVDGVAGVTANTNRGLWLDDPAAQPQLLARSGAGGVAGLPGANFTDFYELALNRTGQIAFAAAVDNHGAALPADSKGIWLIDATGDSLLIAQPGDVVAGRVAEQFSFVGGSGGEDGHARSFNEFGQLAYQAQFASGGATLLYTPDLAWRGPATGDWGDAANWTLGLQPAAVHAVTIGGASGASVNGPTAAETVKRLTLGGGAAAAQLQLQPAGGLTVVEGLTLLPLGQLAGAGAIAGDVANSGVIAPGSSGPARIVIGGDFIQTAAGTLMLTLAGVDNSNPAALQFDQLQISGAATLAGALSVSLASGFVPQIGDMFDVVVAGSLVDTFDSLAFPSLPTDRQWRVFANGSALSLRVDAAAVPESSALAAAAAVLLLSSVAARRRS